MEERPLGEIIQALDACAAAWCERDNPFRLAALDWLGTTTGCATTMLAPALTATFEALRAPYLHSLVARECGGHEAFDEGLVVGDRRLHAVGPALTWVIGAGIVPNAVAVPVFAALVCRSAVLVKTPTREPVFGALLAQSLRAVDPKLGACIAAGWWPGGHEALDTLAADAAEVIIVAGTDDTVRAVEARAGDRTRVLGFGDSVSVVGVGRGQLTDRPVALLWMEIAEAVGWYDQQGCLSPHVVYIEEGGDLSPRQAAERLADAMALYEGKAPRGPVGVEVAAALQSHRDRVEVRAVDTERAGVWAAAPTNAAWVVAFDSESRFVRSPGHRFIHVKPVYDLEDLPAILAQSGERFQAVGLAVDAPRRAALTAAFLPLGASRICPVAKLQRPPVDWPRDGRPVVASLVRWMES